MPGVVMINTNLSEQEIAGQISKQPSIIRKNPAIGGASPGSGVATPAPYLIKGDKQSASKCKNI